MSETLQLVTFRIGNEEFGIDIKKVQEINRMIDITVIPNAPNYIEGVISLRGKIIPIASLRTKLGFGEVDRDNQTRIMIAEVAGSIIGFIVDSVSEVLRIQDAKIEPTPILAGTTDTQYIEGVINLDDRILIVLDMNTMFGKDIKKVSQAA